MDCEREKGVVASAEFRGLIWRREHRFDLGPGEERDQLLLGAFVRNCENTLDERRATGLAQRGVAEERMNRSEPRVSSPDAIPALLLQIRKEPCDERRVEIREIEIGGRLPELVLGEAEEESEGVSIRRDGVRARASLLEQPFCEERLKKRGERTHDRTRSARSSLRPTSAINSGAAVRYQYVDDGSR